MVIAKQILNALLEKGTLNESAIYLETNNEKTQDRLAFLLEKGYITLNPSNEFALTERGQDIVWKI